MVINKQYVWQEHRVETCEYHSLPGNLMFTPKNEVWVSGSTFCGLLVGFHSWKPEFQNDLIWQLWNFPEKSWFQVQSCLFYLVFNNRRGVLLRTLPKTNSSSFRIGNSKGKVVFQPSILQGLCYLQAWNPKQPFINGCFNWMIPNLDIGNGCFTKHPFINGCLGFQEGVNSPLLFRFQQQFLFPPLHHFEARWCVGHGVPKDWNSVQTPWELLIYIYIWCQKKSVDTLQRMRTNY